MENQVQQMDRNLKIFSSYDNKAKIWSRPMFAPNEGSMLRSWADIANDKSHPIGQHPEDYTLYIIGEFDEFEGTFLIHETRTSLGLASGFVKQQAQQQPMMMPQQSLTEGMKIPGEKNNG